MLDALALRSALLDLAEYGRVYVLRVETALQIADAWPDEVHLAQADGFWCVTSLEVRRAQAG